MVPCGLAAALTGLWMTLCYLESGDVKVVIDKAYALDDAASAVAHMLEHHARGQVVIVVWRKSPKATPACQVWFVS